MAANSQPNAATATVTYTVRGVSAVQNRSQRWPGPLTESTASRSALRSIAMPPRTVQRAYGSWPRSNRRAVPA